MDPEIDHARQILYDPCQKRPTKGPQHPYLSIILHRPLCNRETKNIQIILTFGSRDMALLILDGPIAPLGCLETTKL